MSTSTATNVHTDPRPSRAWAPPAWVWGGLIGMMGILAVCLFLPVIQRTFLIATDSQTVWVGIGHLMRGQFQPDWSHALLLPLISLYYIVQNRETLAAQWRNPAPGPADLGPALRMVAVILGAPALLLAYEIRHANTAAGRVAFLFTAVLAAAAATVFLLGPRLLGSGGKPGTATRVAGLLRLAGLGLFFAGTFSFGWWLGPGRNDMLQGYSMIVAVFGLTMACLGPAMMKTLAFPIFYLALGFKVSDRYWDLLADRLRVVVAHAATVVLGTLSLNVDLNGSRITILPAHGPVIPLDVVDACSGLRSLMAYVALGAAVAWLSPRPGWQKWAMLALTVPVAVVVNIGRLTVLGLLSLRWPSLAQGQAHIFIGMLMLIPALLLLLLIGWVLDHLMVRDSATQRSAPAIAPARAAPDSLVPRRWLAGGAGGLLLAGMLGVCYLLAMTLLRPKDMFQGHLFPGLAGGLLTAAAVLVVPALVLARRALLADSDRGLAGHSGALGLTTGILLACVLGMNTVVAASNWVIFKLPVPLRHEFVKIPANVGPWLRTHDFPFAPEEREVLGPWAVNWLYERTDRPGDPPVGLHLTYYTGMVDTVPHVPERCELAGGATEQDRATVTLRLGGPDYHPPSPGAPPGVFAPSKLAGGSIRVPHTQIAATLIPFVSTDGQHYCVIYFFVANGGYFANPDGVRAKGFDPRDRYNYYCKVQMKLLTGDGLAATDQASRLLSAVMPEVLACLPDWDQVVAGLWPGNQR